MTGNIEAHFPDERVRFPPQKTMKSPSIPILATCVALSASSVSAIDRA